VDADLASFRSVAGRKLRAEGRGPRGANVCQSIKVCRVVYFVAKLQICG